jgi:hypothetical protein
MGFAAVGILRVDRQRGLSTQAFQHHVFPTSGLDDHMVVWRKRKDISLG